MKKKNRVRLLSSVLMTSLLLLQGTMAVAGSESGKETSRSTAQNFSEVQGQMSSSQNEALSNAGQVKGAIPLDISHATLDNAVQAAKDAGLFVVQDGTLDKGIVKGKRAIDNMENQIADDYTSQAASINQSLVDYQKAMTTYKAAAQIANGYPTTIKGQSLTLSSNQPNSKVDSASFTGSGKFLHQLSIYFFTNVAGNKTLVSTDDSHSTASPDIFKWGENGEGFDIALEPGASITVNYSGLNRGNEIGGVTSTKAQVTWKNTSNIKIFMFIPTSPFRQIWYGVNTQDQFTRQPLSVQQTDIFLDKDNKPIVISPNKDAVGQFFVGSLNYTSAIDSKGNIAGQGYNSHEAATFGPGSTQVGLLNSSVTKVAGLPVSGNNGGGDSYGSGTSGTETWAAPVFNDYKHNNSALLYPVEQWDAGTGANLHWYGGLDQMINVGETKASVMFSTTTGQMWYQYNTNLDTLPPKIPTLHYHYYKATAQPENLKTVSGTDGQDLDGQLVNKQQIEDWHLTADPLPAYRDARKDLKITDVLPNGFVPDVDRTKALSPDYEVSYDEASNTMTFTAPQALLDKANADLTKDWAIPAPVIEGKVTNDDGLYKNNFILDTNDYSVTSNVVSVHTPGGDTTPPPGGPGNPDNPDQPNTPDTPKPSKTNENAAGDTIDGQGISDQATNFYKMTWDLKPYEGIASSKDDIARGFYFIDDAPEVVNVDAKNTKYEDTNGKPVEGIYATLYNEVNDAPTDVQARLKRDGLAPKGQFVYYNVSDPQSFYTNYVQKGINIIIKTPMTFKEGVTGDYENVDYQSDFGNGYEGDTVKNHIVPPTVKKFVSIDGGKTWQTTDQLKAKNSTYDYKLDYSFTANGDYTKINLTDSFESVQWTDLSKAKLVSSDGKTIAGTFKVLDSTGKDVTADYNKHTYQTDGKKEALQLVFTPDKISDLTALASKSDKDALVKVSLMLDDVTIKGASDAEVKLYTDSKGNIDVPNVGALTTTSKTDTGSNTPNQVTKSNKVDVKLAENAPTNPLVTNSRGDSSNSSSYGKSLPTTGDIAVKGLMGLGFGLLSLAAFLKHKIIIEKALKIFRKLDK